MTDEAPKMQRLDSLGTPIGDIDYGPPIGKVVAPPAMTSIGLTGCYLWACPLCGAVVVLRPIHDEWHRKQQTE